MYYYFLRSFLVKISNNSYFNLGIEIMLLNRNKKRKEKKHKIKLSTKSAGPKLKIEPTSTKTLHKS